jgi:uncharacterized phage-associated protein
VATFDRQRFQELVLYISERTVDDPDFGRTKLAKALFYSDQEAYRELGEPITAAPYLAWEHGPFPRPLASAERLLRAAGRAHAAEESVRDFEEIRLVPTGARPANLARVGISPAQRRIVDSWVDRIRHATAREIEDLSHDHPGYRLAGRDNEIRYDSALLAQRPPTDEEVDAARRIAQERGWLVGGEWRRSPPLPPSALGDRCHRPHTVAALLKHITAVRHEWHTEGKRDE